MHLLRKLAPYTQLQESTLFFIYRYTSPIHQHDLVVWAGDLNYRVHVDLPVEMVLDNAKNNNLAPLLAKDQLLNQMLIGRVFEGYKEGILRF